MLLGAVALHGVIAAERVVVKLMSDDLGAVTAPRCLWTT